MEGVVCKSRVSEMNENGRKLIKGYTNKKLNAGNKFFQKKDIHKVAWVSGEDSCKRLLNFIVAQEEDGNKFLDVNIFRGA